MGQLDQIQDKVLSLFFDYPQKVFGLRELSRLSKTPKSSLQRELAGLIKQKIVQKNQKGYRAAETNLEYRFIKRNHLILRIYNSGLVDFLQRSTLASTILLFGSGAKGEYVHKSDLDVFIQAKEKSLNLRPFEKKLKRTINLIFKEDLNLLSPELLNNIINGYKLSGYIKIK